MAIRMSCGGFQKWRWFCAISKHVKKLHCHNMTCVKCQREKEIKTMTTILMQTIKNLCCLEMSCPWKFGDVWNIFLYIWCIWRACHALHLLCCHLLACAGDSGWLNHLGRRLTVTWLVIIKYYTGCLTHNSVPFQVIMSTECQVWCWYWLKEPPDKIKWLNLI